MANWQVISLDTTTPQLRAPGTGDGYSFNSGSTQLGVWTTTGLGIGTASPSSGYKLDVNGSMQAASSASNYVAARFVAASGGPSNIELVRAGYAAWYIGSRNNDTAFNITVSDQTHATPFLTIGQTGNVGIGTASPAGYRLRLNSTDRALYATTAGATAALPAVYLSDSTHSVDGVLTPESGQLRFGSFTSHPVVFVAGNTERARITATGDVGIGTASPGSRLEVLNGGDSIVTITGNTASGNFASVDFKRNTGTVNAAVRSQSVGGNDIGEMYFMTRPNAGSLTERMRLDSSGNLGLGVTPSAWTSSRRAIQVGAGACIEGSTSNATFTEVGANFFVNTVGGADTYIASAAASKYNQSSGIHSWHTAASGTAGNAITFTQAMTLDADGDLGVGTTSPTTVSNYRAITVNGTNGGILDLKYGDTLGGRVVGNSGGLALETGGATIISFQTNGSERARIDSSGNVGIGTTSPSAKLSVSSGNIFVDNANGSVIIRNADATNQQQIRVRMSGNDGVLDVTRASGTAPNLIFGTEAVERARITSGGDLLVGTTSQLYGEKFNVTNGGVGKNCSTLYFNTSDDRAAEIIRHARASGATQASMIAFLDSAGTERGSIKTDGSATAYNTSSDRRLKENIVSSNDAGAVIDSIEIVQHDWKSGGHVRYGVIAQDLHKVAPEAVSAGDDGEEIEKTWGVDYSKLVPMLVKEIQSLRARVAQLEAK